MTADANHHGTQMLMLSVHGLVEQTLNNFYQDYPNSIPYSSGSRANAPAGQATSGALT